MKIITLTLPPDAMLGTIYAMQSVQPGEKIGLARPVEGGNHVIGQVVAIHHGLNKVSLLIED